MRAIIITALVAASVGSARAEGSYMRGLLNYDIRTECQSSIMAMRGGISSGQIVPDRDIPDCINRDSAALASLDQGWRQVPEQRREQCLASFGRAGSQNLALRYYTIAQCVGINP